MKGGCESEGRKWDGFDSVNFINKVRKGREKILFDSLPLAPNWPAVLSGHKGMQDLQGSINWADAEVCLSFREQIKKKIYVSS